MCVCVCFRACLAVSGSIVAETTELELHHNHDLVITLFHEVSLF